MSVATQTKCPIYKRREPELSLIYQTVQNHWPAFVDNRNAEGRPLPKYVIEEMESYLRCGILTFGFVRLKCGDCENEMIVAFSCKKRGFCPSCCAKRSAEAAMHLLDNILPYHRYRQFVVTFPIPLRYWMHTNKLLFAKIHSIVLKQIHNFYKQKAIEHGIKDPIPGAISFTQRFGSALNLNVHLHILFLDGVYTMVDEKPVFRNLLGISNDEVEETIAAIATKVIKYLQKQGYLDQDGEIVANPLMDDLFQDNEAMLLATTNSIAGKIAFGPNAGNSVTKIGSGFGYMEEIPFAKGDRCYSVNGFTLHAKTAVNSQSRDKLEKLISYISRGPIATERVTLTPDGQHILLQLKRPYDDGTTHLKFTPGEFIEKLVAIVPPPKTHLVRWSGCFASNSPIRSKIVLRPTVKKGFQFDEENPAKPRRVGWNEVLKHVFKIDVLVCTECGGTLKAIAAVRDPDQIARYLKHVGLGADPPKLAIVKLQQGELNYEVEH